MTARKGLVLDANILLRAVFGQRVRQILEAYEDQANFYAPDVCFQDARKYIPEVSLRRRFDFFGSGFATWTTDRVELFLREL